MSDTLAFPSREGVRPPGAPVPAELAGESPAVRHMLLALDQASAGQGCVLLVAEAGSDVEAVARQVHFRSRMATGPFVAVDGGAGDPLDLTHLLFGDAASGSPSELELVGADSRIAAAAGGTLFLRDADELPALLQDRLARIARDGDVRTPVSDAPCRIRLVASCVAALEAQAERDRFRTDLYRRLAAARIEVPPLRRRSEDIPAITAQLVEEICHVAGFAPKPFTPTALTLLAALRWPGNLRELRSLIARLITSVDGSMIRLDDLLSHIRLEATPSNPVPHGSLREARLRFEREYIAAVLQHHHWRISEAARTLGIQRPNLYRKARQLGIALLKATD
ncbi:MAG TPA: sigma 54-interacting transcriptional regulator [Vicinamibacterales bacterium]|nr:sigma 54-interacting transcriptional regulator [Vicinamibacterales bacterium]